MDVSPPLYDRLLGGSCRLIYALIFIIRRLKICRFSFWDDFCLKGGSNPVFYVPPSNRHFILAISYFSKVFQILMHNRRQPNLEFWICHTPDIKKSRLPTKD